MHNPKFISLEQVCTDSAEAAGLSLLNVDVTVSQGTTLVVHGPPNKGKSGFLLLIAGLIEPERGGVICNGKEVTGPGPERALVPQWPALLPWLTAYQNVFLAVNRAHGRHKSRDELHVDTAIALQRMQLGNVMHTRASRLTQDQQQRVSIARALVVRPRVLLLDEPFATLETATLAWLPATLEHLIQEHHITTVVTHNDNPFPYLHPSQYFEVGAAACQPA